MTVAAENGRTNTSLVTQDGQGDIGSSRAVVPMCQVHRIPGSSGSRPSEIILFNFLAFTTDKGDTVAVTAKDSRGTCDSVDDEWKDDPACEWTL